VKTAVAFALFLTLFLPDLWVIGNPSNSSDSILDGVLLACFTIFSLEVVAK
jgi:hypothetical protein